jgi:hypothetical protein
MNVESLPVPVPDADELLKVGCSQAWVQIFLQPKISHIGFSEISLCYCINEPV